MERVAILGANLQLKQDLYQKLDGLWGERLF